MITPTAASPKPKSQAHTSLQASLQVLQSKAVPTPAPAAMRWVWCQQERHASAILEIFNDAILHSTALYEYQPRTFIFMQDWFANKAASGLPVLGLEDAQGRLAGFASYSTFRSFPAFHYTVEHALYLHPDFRAQGLGARLLAGLIACATAQERHVLVGAIDNGNHASLALHRKLGFTLAGVIAQAGFKFGRWLDLAFYQKILATPAQPQAL